MFNGSSVHVLRVRVMRVSVWDRKLLIQRGVVSRSQPAMQMCVHVTFKVTPRAFLFRCDASCPIAPFYTRKNYISQIWLLSQRKVVPNVPRLSHSDIVRSSPHATATHFAMCVVLRVRAFVFWKPCFTLIQLGHVSCACGHGQASLQCLLRPISVHAAIHASWNCITSHPDAAPQQSARRVVSGPRFSIHLLQTCI